MTSGRRLAQAPYQSRKVHPPRDKLPRNHAHNARDIDDGSEVAAPSSRFVDRWDRDADQPRAPASGLDEKLAFEDEARCAVTTRAHGPEQRSRIHAKARLAVLDRLTCGPRDPEIGKTVREVPVGRRVGTSFLARTDNDRVRALLVRGK